MKAKDLLKKTKEDEPKSISSQEEKVEEAYDNITKRLEALRQVDSDNDEVEVKAPVDDDIGAEDDGTVPEKPHAELDSEEKDENLNPVDDGPADDGREESREDITGLDTKEETENDRTLDDLALEKETTPKSAFGKEEQADSFSIPNLHSQRPKLNFQYREHPKPEKKSMKNFFILSAVGLGVFGIAVFLLKNFSLSPKNPSPSPSITTALITTPTPTPTPVPTMSPEERSKYKVRVLNGTTKTGMAASVSAKLKELGYQTGKATNATNSAFTKTIVRVKPANQSLAQQLIKDLFPDFDASAVLDLKENDTSDGEVILGTK